MLLMVFWGSLGLVLGALGPPLRTLLVLLRALGGTLNSQNFGLGSLPGNLLFFCVLSVAPFLEIVVFLIFEHLVGTGRLQTC